MTFGNHVTRIINGGKLAYCENASCNWSFAHRSVELVRVKAGAHESCGG